MESKYFDICSTALSVLGDTLTCPAPPSSHPMSGLCCKSHFNASLPLQTQGK